MVDIVVVGKVSVIEEKVMPIGYLLEPVHVQRVYVTMWRIVLNEVPVVVRRNLCPEVHVEPNSRGRLYRD